nr:uncharacterized protein LOC103405083 [Malus domestica]
MIREGHIVGSSSGIQVCDNPGFEPQNKRRKEDHIVGSSSGIQVCDKLGFESENERQKNVDNVCSTSTNTVQTTVNVDTFDNPNQISKGQANFQKNKKANVQKYVDLGDKKYKCIYCGALFWTKESLKQKSKNNEPLYSLCCQQGKVKLPRPMLTPHFLENLLDPTKGQTSLLFRENIRAYNSMFAFTSMGAKVDHTVNNQLGPYIFKISGQVHHLMGSLLPPDGECPKFAQLHVYDTANEIGNRFNAINCKETNMKLDENIVKGLNNMFNESNELLNDDKQYGQPTCDEIAGLIVGDIGQFDSNRDIVIEFKDGELKRVTKLNPKFMSYGEDGYSPDLKLNIPSNNRPCKRGRVTMRAFIPYQIQERESQLDTLLKGGRLFQQFLVDAYATLEEDRLDYIRKNQKSLRSEVYKGIYDAVSKGDHDADNIGKRVILPSSYTGSPRYMLNNYQDAMAICRQFGYLDLFITFTCNIKWPEIVREFDIKLGYKSEDRPYIISRVFKMKFDDMISYIKSGESGEPFGEVEPDVCTIEFQKRRLPHAHILIWLKKPYKCYSADDIDSIISAEIPNKNSDPLL